ncbi:uncharacterized protein LOC119773977 [Cyprinodon tularosa]|uniref:uncharacterized protein LOC119773977 n=1 Tax=Cyprinodon tularosa TaxID=77115 RepID=UPI0018E1FE63|nr:uncharacterized protein LOC119773977 [Cyprinodon tularosa]XP_038127149.1 uncharacterized protein LOC119773977 [Cyprinodon tularosa]
MEEDSEKHAMSQRIRELESQLAELQAAGGDSETPTTSTGTTSGRPTFSIPQAPIIYVQQDRKLPVFSGHLNSNDSWTLEEWIERIRHFAESRGCTEKERAQIVFDHLEGAARTEVKFLPPQQRECMDSIFNILREVYGCMHSHVSLQRRFYNRKQQDGESLIDYSHSLMDLMDMIVKSDAQVVSRVVSKDLRDQFIDGIRDQTLKIRLRDLVNANPNWTIREARAEATKWMAQCGAPSKSVRLVSNETVVSCEATTGSSQYLELMSLLKAQQTQLELVVKALAPQSLPPARGRFNRPRRNADGKPICFRCEQSGHIARNCPNNIQNEAKEDNQNESKSAGN